VDLYLDQQAIDMELTQIAPERRRIGPQTLFYFSAAC